MVIKASLAAGIIAALSISAPHAASAADLYGPDFRYDNGAYADEDERYAEGYRQDEYRRYDEERYAEPRDAYRGSTKDGGYLEPLERAPRFSEDRYDRADACAPRWQIRNRLQARGWSNFERLAVRPRVVVLRAERFDGRPFVLKLDRCSGHILAERPARFRGYGFYGPGPRRYGYAY